MFGVGRGTRSVVAPAVDAAILLVLDVADHLAAEPVPWLGTPDAATPTR
jgi:hypothetical protein